MIRCLDDEALKSADESILEYLLPYIRLSAINFSQALDELRQETYIVNAIGDDDDLDIRSLEQFWRNFVLLRDNFRISYDNLAQLPPSDSRDKHLADYRQLSDRINQFEQDIRDSLDRKVGILSLRESRQSIKEAETVRRLSQLAFIFIPHTFVTSCFGMNLQLLGGGRGELSSFFIAAASVTAAVLVLPQGHFMAKRNVEPYTRPLRVTIKLAKYCPIEALWMVWFAIGHLGKLGMFLVRMGLYHKFLGDDFGTINQFAPEKTLKLSSSWQETGQKIFDFFRVDGWGEKPPGSGGGSLASELRLKSEENG